MRILVVGAGGTGGFFGGRLAEAGRDVTFLVRPGRAAVLRERGLRIVGPDEHSVIEPRLVLADRVGGPFDVVLLGVKAAGLAGAIDDLAPGVGPNTLVIPMLNGMRHVEALVARFGDRVLGGVVKVQTTLDDNGDIRRLGDLRGMSFGRLDGQPDTRVDDAARALGGAGFDVSVSSDITGEMWAKWVFIANLGIVTILMRGTVGEVVAVPGGVEFAEAVVAETAAVAEAAGHPLPDAARKTTTAVVTAAGSPDSPSAYRDLVAGNSVEVEQIFGDLADRARALGVAVPLLDLVTMNLRVYQNRLGS